mmetsp:Transcript_15056/g.46850  ORF Transcript_15056/g.46850 Transcript_15056/m.46850 type:complete len:222 (+) Transcript_15056:2110-2775(+)
MVARTSLALALAAATASLAARTLASPPASSMPCSATFAFLMSFCSEAIVRAAVLTLLVQWVFWRAASFASFLAALSASITGFAWPLISSMRATMAETPPSPWRASVSASLALASASCAFCSAASFCCACSATVPASSRASSASRCLAATHAQIACSRTFPMLSSMSRISWYSRIFCSSSSSFSFSLSTSCCASLRMAFMAFFFSMPSTRLARNSSSWVARM